MQCRSVSDVGNLVAAAGAGGDDVGVFGQGIEEIFQGLGDFEAEVVFFLHGAEGAGHTAAAAVEELCAIACQTCCQLEHDSSVSECFGVAVGVDGDAVAVLLEG